MSLIKKWVPSLFFVFVFFSSFQQLEGCPFCKKDANKLEALSKEYYDFCIKQFPEVATLQGVRGFDHLWTDLSEESLKQKRIKIAEMLEDLNEISTEFLLEEERLSYETLKVILETAVEHSSFKEEYLIMNKLNGTHLEIGMILNAMPATNIVEICNLLSRLQGIPQLIDQTIFLLEQGVIEGITPALVSIQEVPNQIKHILTENPSDSYYFIPFANLPTSLDEDYKNYVKGKASKILSEKVFPALKRLHDYLVEEYIPQCRETIAFSDLPNGKQWYLQCIKLQTTTNLSPKKIHKMGLTEVDRIHTAMHVIKEEANFSGTLKEFFSHVRQDPSFYFTSRTDLIEGYQNILEQVKEKLSTQFNRLPESPCVIVPVPESSEEQTVVAYYLEGSLKSNRPGQFFVNTGHLETKPKWEMEAIALHEALPGHHLQISLALENKTLPLFHTLVNFNAYTEGWGLYAEGLGKALGLYRDPYSRFGRLNMEMLRAVRLVVDTGIHVLGWTRQMAIDYCLENTGLSLHEITNEVDRYITWPGQALAYKIGEQTILEMRHYAEEKLGPAFDVREFHDEVLRHGSLPLQLFKAKIEKWVDQGGRALPEAQT